jgi:HSP20 family protein
LLCATDKKKTSERSRLKFTAGENNPRRRSAMARTLVPWSTRFPRVWGEFEREMGDVMKRMFDWDDSGDAAMSFSPRLNVAETENGYEVAVDLPGMKPEEFNVEFREGDLWITGERKQETEEKEKTFHRIERRYGTFRRILRLGTDVDPATIDASYSDGVLRITAARTEASRPQRIEVHA